MRVLRDIVVVHEVVAVQRGDVVSCGIAIRNEFRIYKKRIDVRWRRVTLGCGLFLLLLNPFIEQA